MELLIQCHLIHDQINDYLISQRSAQQVMNVQAHATDQLALTGFEAIYEKTHYDWVGTEDGKRAYYHTR